MTASAATQPGIIGRDDVLNACDAALQRMMDGNGGLLLIAGEPGIGKTTVLQSLAGLASDRGCVVRWAACPEDNAAPAFWPVVRVLSDPPDPTLAAVAADLGAPAAEAGEHRFVLFDRVAAALSAAGDAAPQVLVLDDLHWSDPSTLRLVGFLVKQLRTSRVLLVGSYRDTDVTPGHPLLELLAEPGTSGETLTLTGLSVEDVATLVTRASRTSSPPAATSIREHTGGNPFFVLHVARLLDAEGHLAGRDRALPLPVGVRAVLERRIARLSQPCHELLGVAAVIGAQFDVRLLAAVSGVDADAVADLLDESAAARLTQAADDGRQHAFAHALIRATLAGQLSARRRAALNAAVADALVARHGDDPGHLARIAHHELNAGDDRAATRGVHAAERAARHAFEARAFEQAAEQFAMAIDAARDPEQLADLGLAMGDALLRAGDWDRAAEAFTTSANLAREHGWADTLAEAALGVGADTGGFEVRLHDQRQIAMLTEALEGLGEELPALRARLLARLSVATTNVATPAERSAWADEALRLACSAGEPRALAHALSAWCDANAGPAATDARLDAAAEMLVVGERSADPETILIAHRFRIVGLLERGDPAAHEEIERFVSVAESMGQPLYGWYVPLFRGMQALLRGDLEGADRGSADAFALGAAAGSANAEMLAGTQAAAIGLERGKLRELATALDEAMTQHPWFQDLPVAIAMAAMIDIGFGEAEQARAKLHGMAARRCAFVPDDSEWLSTMSGITTACLLLSDETSAAVLYDVLRPHAGRVVVDGIGASCLDPVDYLLGRLAEVLGRDDEAVGHLEAAIEQTRHLGAPLLEAHAQHALGAAVMARDAQRGTELQASAEAVLRAAGAAPLLVFGPADLEDDPAAPGDLRAESGGRQGVFRRDGVMWTLTFEAQTVRLPDAKGLHDLRHLLAHPGLAVPAAALQGTDVAQAPAAVSRGVEALDDQAREAYRVRLRDLDDEVDEAEANNDPERAARLRMERGFLLSELSAAVGLGGRSRRLGDDADRARKAVTMRIRNAIDRITREHPALGRHLSATVKTGRVCSYDPEHPVSWTV